MDQTKSVILRRLRDYHHPDATLGAEKDKKNLKFNKFILALIGLWLKTEEDVY